MNKRGGSWSLLQFVSVIGGILAALLLVVIVSKFTSQEKSEYAFLTIDSAMMVDAILSAPQDVQVVYPREFERWYVRLDNNTISFIPRRDIAMIRDDVKMAAMFFIKENVTFRIDNKPARETPEEEK